MNQQHIEHSKAIRSAVRTLKIAVVFLPIALVTGLWMTRGGPIVPRLTGAAMNILITLWFVYLIRKARSCDPRNRSE